MRCLYCGKELALLKRLTGGGEFCSEAHKKSYQEEYNRIALTRLLQAQAKSAKNAPSIEKAAPPPAATVAVEDPIEEPVEEKLEEPPEVYFEPAESAGFFLEQPAISAPPETTPYLEQWLEIAPRPAAPSWLFVEARNSDLPSAGLLPLEGRPQARDSDRTVQEVNVTPKEFTATPERPRAPFSMVPRNTLQGAGPITQRIAPHPPSPKVQGTMEALSGFPSEPEYRGSTLLGVFSSTIDFPAEDAEVAVISATMAAVEVQPVDAAADVFPEPQIEPLPVEPEGQESVPDATPNAALEALAKVHLEQPAEPSPVEEPVAETVVTEPEQPVIAAPELAPVAEAAPVEPEPAPVMETVSAEPDGPSPRASTEFIEISVRSFTPPKAITVDGGALVRERPALLPRLTGLPLRPKVALAPNQSAAAAKAPATKASKAMTPPSAPASAKPPVKTIPVIPPAQPKPAPAPSARSVKPANPVQPAQPAAPPSPAQPAAPKVATPAVPAATLAAKAAPAVESGAATAHETKTSAAAPKPQVLKDAPTPQESAPPPMETTAPTFGSMQLKSTSIWGGAQIQTGDRAGAAGGGLHRVSWLGNKVQQTGVRSSNCGGRSGSQHYGGGRRMGGKLGRRSGRRALWTTDYHLSPIAEAGRLPGGIPGPDRQQ